MLHVFLILDISIELIAQLAIYSLSLIPRILSWINHAQCTQYAFIAKPFLDTIHSAPFFGWEDCQKKTYPFTIKSFTPLIKIVNERSFLFLRYIRWLKLNKSRFKNRITKYGQTQDKNTDSPFCFYRNRHNGHLRLKHGSYYAHMTDVV